MDGKTFFELFINLAETLIITWFYTEYLESRFKGVKKYACFIAMWILAFVEVCIINQTTVLESVGAYIPIVRYFIYGLLCLNGSVLFKLWIAVITHIIVVVVAVVSNVGICYLIDYSTYDMITVFNGTRIISVIVTKLILLAVFLILLKHRQQNPIKNKLWYSLLVVPVLSVVSVSWLMQITLSHDEVKGHVLAGMLCIVTANIMIYYFYTVISREYENQLKLSLLEKQNENSRREIAEADAFVRQMKTVSHDMKNHLLAISAYIRNGNTEEAQSYIKEITDEHIPAIQPVIDSGNRAFDAILNAKLAVCAQKKIFMEIKIMKDSLSWLDPVDTGIVFGNLIDNAIEAAEKTDTRHICIISAIKGKYLSIVVSNSIASGVLENNKNLETTKKRKNMHGMGINSVTNTVKKYEGIVRFSEENGEFICHVLLLLKDQSC